MTTLSKISRSLCALALPLLLATGSAQAQIDGSWTGTYSGTARYWSNAANWFSGTVAGGAGSVVDFTKDITGNTYSYIDTNSRTVGTINIGDNSFQYLLSGTLGGSLIFDSGVEGVAAQLNYVAATGATVQIQAGLPILLNSSLDITNSGSWSQSIATTISAGTAGVKILSVNSGTVTLAGIISDGAGTVGITMDSPGVMVLSTANTYTGTVTLSGGVLRANNDGAFGSGGTLILTGGTLSSSSTRSYGAKTIRLGGNVAFGEADAVTNQMQFSNAGSMTLTQSSTLTVNNTLYYRAGIGDEGNNYSLTKSGTGRLRFTGTATYTGGTFINEGRFVLEGAGGGSGLADTGNVTLGGGTLDTYATIDTVGDVFLNSGTITNTAAGGGLNAASYTVSEGTLDATLTGTGALTKIGSGTVLFDSNGSLYTGSNNYTGGTNINEGVLQLSGTGQLAQTGAIKANGGNFNLGGGTHIVGAVTLNGGTISNGTLAASSYTGSSGVSSAVLSGTGSFTKSGTGTVVLSATNTYTGFTSVDAGTLLVEGEIAADSAVSVITSGTLGGSGRINGTVTVGDGGVLAPGSSPGVLEIGGLILENGSETVMEIGGMDRGLTFDGIDILDINSLVYDGTLTLNFTAATAFGNIYDLFNFSGLASGSFDSVLLTGFYTGSLINNGFGVWSGMDDDETFVFTFNQTSGDLGVIPEPSTWALLIGGLSVLAVFRRRRSQS